MSAPVVVYCNAPKKAWEALFATGTLKYVLATASYTPDQDLHDFQNDITNEAAGTGYVAGGNALTGVVVSLDTATNTITIKADEITGLNVSCRWLIFVVSTGTAATSPVVAYADLSEGLGGNVTFTNTTNLSTVGFQQAVVP